MEVPGEHLSLRSTAEQNCKNSLSFRRGRDCPRDHGAAKSLGTSVLCIVLPGSQYTALSKRLQL